MATEAPPALPIPEAWKPFLKPDAIGPPVPIVTSEHLELIKRTVAAGATADELKLYLYDCARQGVHPLDKLIHFTKRGGKYTPITSIDFMRMRAADSGEYAGSDDASFLVGIDNPNGPTEAKVTVWRLVQGQRCSFTATARWSEYKPAEDFMWKRMPHTMLAKCAEALALRKGFPRQLAGLYAKEEMDQAGEARGGYSVQAPQVAEQSAPDFRTTQNTGTLPDLPDWAVRIERVDTAPTKNPNVTKFRITLSTGEVVTTIKSQLGALCEQLAQDNIPVTVETKPTKWGTDLLSVHRIEAEIQLRSDLGEEAPF